MADRDLPATSPRPGADAPTLPRRRGPPPELHEGCALFLDIDGTLLDLAPTPDSVRVDAGISALLPALAQRLDGAVALITGRSMADADGLFRGLSLPIAGQHGLERRAADGSLHRHLPSFAGLERLRRDLTEFVAQHDGLMLEDKGTTLALHYRQAPRLASHVHRTLRSHLAAALANEAGWGLQPGKGVLEVKPDGRDKGTVILEYMDEAPFCPAAAGLRRRRQDRRIRFRRRYRRRRMGRQGGSRHHERQLSSGECRRRAQVALRAGSGGHRQKEKAPCRVIWISR
jgi:trehalose 6-phosphate phosphatase